MQLAMARFKKDKLSMIAFAIVAVYIVLGLSAPFLVKFGVLDPFSFNSNNNVLDIEAGAIPRGALSGMTWQHPLGCRAGHRARRRRPGCCSASPSR